MTITRAEWERREEKARVKQNKCRDNIPKNKDRGYRTVETLRTER